MRWTRSTSESRLALTVRPMQGVARYGFLPAGFARNLRICVTRHTRAAARGACGCQRCRRLSQFSFLTPMSNKHDVDNRANHLNPNNGAYASSRGLGASGDDGGDEAVAAIFHPQSRANPQFERTSEAKNFDMQWVAEMPVSYVTASLRPGSLTVLGGSRSELRDALKTLWSTNNFLYLASVINGTTLFLQDGIEALADPRRLEQAREAFAEMKGTPRHNSGSEMPFIPTTLMHKPQCSISDLQGFRFWVEV